MKFSEINVSQIYFWLKDISVCENFLSKIRGFIKLQKKNRGENFFKFLMLNISSMKKLFHKPSEIQWNIAGTLLGKLKLKNLDFILQDITPWNHKNMKNCYFGRYFEGLGTTMNFNGFLWLCESLKVSASIFRLKTVLTLK